MTKSDQPVGQTSPTPGRDDDRPVAASGRQRHTGRWALAAVTVAFVAMTVAVVIVALSGGSGETAATDIETGSDGGGGEPPTTDPAAGPLDGFRSHTGQHFTVEVPDALATTFEDRLVNVDPESLVTRWEVPFESVVTITTSSPITGTVEQDCAQIFGDRDVRSLLVAPTTTPVGDKDACEFAYVRPDGQVRVEYLFAIGTREFLVTVGDRTEAEARGSAVHAVETLQPT